MYVRVIAIAVNGRGKKAISPGDPLFNRGDGRLDRRRRPKQTPVAYACDPVKAGEQRVITVNMC